MRKDWYRLLRDKSDGLDVEGVLKKAKKEKRLQDWEEKALHGQYLRQTEDVVSKAGFGFRIEI